jgi:hypothetical protein
MARKSKIVLIFGMGIVFLATILWIPYPSSPVPEWKLTANGEVVFPQRPLKSRLLFGDFKKTSKCSHFCLLEG